MAKKSVDKHFINFNLKKKLHALNFVCNVFDVRGFFPNFAVENFYG